MINVIAKLNEFMNSKKEFDISPCELQHILKEVRHFVKGMHTTEDKLLAYDYALFIFRSEYAAKTRTRLFRWKNPTPIKYLFPMYYTIDGIEHSLTCIGQKEIQLNEDTAVCAWKVNRLRNILTVVHRYGFFEDETNHYADYYPELNLVTVISGNHSASAGVFMKSGSIHADVYELSEMFEHVITDGEIWINKHTGEKISDVYEPYMSILYTIAQDKFEFQKSLVEKEV